LVVGESGVEGIEVRRKEDERILDCTLRDGWRPWPGFEGVSGSGTVSLSSIASELSLLMVSAAVFKASALEVASPCVGGGGGSATPLVDLSSSFFLSAALSPGFLPFSFCFFSCSNCRAQISIRCPTEAPRMKS